MSEMTLTAAEYFIEPMSEMTLEIQYIGFVA